jgi:hypothetical protein
MVGDLHFDCVVIALGLVLSVVAETIAGDLHFDIVVVASGLFDFDWRRFGCGISWSC